MTTTLIHAARALTPSTEINNVGILIREDVIEAIGPRGGLSLPAGAREIRATGKTAIPGFVDVHIHGAGGHDVMEGSREAMAGVTRTVARHGTTAFVATTVTASPEDTLRSVAGISKYIAEQHQTNDPRAEVLGIHFEGPFISAVRRGVHPLEWVKLPSPELLGKFLQAAAGNAQILTIAPELIGAIPCIDVARKAGLVVALGHTDATYEQARAGIAHGDEAAMKLLLQAKGAGGVILISDGISATGMPDGKYMLGTFEVTVSGGVCRNAEGKLAGSTLTLDRALRNIVGLGVSLPDAVRMLTLNPASLLGIEFKKGSLRVGADADILLLDERLQVAGVWARGVALN